MCSGSFVSRPLASTAPGIVKSRAPRPPSMLPSLPIDPRFSRAEWPPRLVLRYRDSPNYARIGRNSRDQVLAVVRTSPESARYDSRQMLKTLCSSRGREAAGGYGSEELLDLLGDGGRDLLVPAPAEVKLVGLVCRRQ